MYTHQHVVRCRYMMKAVLTELHIVSCVSAQDADHFSYFVQSFVDMII